MKNQNLEKLVKNRTENLEKTQEKLQESAFENEKLYKELLKKNKDLEIILEEKNILIKEIHHRVKNNMQIISSMLELQLDYIFDERDKDLFVNNGTTFIIKFKIF